MRHSAAFARQARNLGTPIRAGEALPSARRRRGRQPTWAGCGSPSKRAFRSRPRTWQRGCERHNLQVIDLHALGVTRTRPLPRRVLVVRPGPAAAVDVAPCAACRRPRSEAPVVQLTSGPKIVGSLPRPRAGRGGRAGHKTPPVDGAVRAGDGRDQERGPHAPQRITRLIFTHRRGGLD